MGFPAACLKILVSFDTLNFSEEIISPRNLPAPTEGN